MKKNLATVAVIGFLSFSLGLASAAVTGITVGGQAGVLVSGTAGSATYVLSFPKSNGASSISGLSVSGLPSGTSFVLSATSSSTLGQDPVPDVTLTISASGLAQAGTTTFSVLSSTPALSATGTLAIGAAPSTPSCGTSTFDTFSNGSVNGQQGWHVSGPFDQAVVDNTYGYASFGCKTLRISNATTSQFIFNQIFSSSTLEAGEVSSLNSNGATGTPRNYFEAQFDLTSVMQNEQPGMHLSVSPDRGDGTRMSSLGFADTANGIDVFFDDVTGTTTPVVFHESQIATALSRSTPHTIKYTMNFVDGPSNDIVKVFIDGILAHTGTSWENFYRFDSGAFPAPNPNLSRTVNSLVFYEQAPGFIANQSKGFLVDNLSLFATTTSSAATTTTSAPRPPIITLNGSSTMSILLNSVFTDPGATAIDSASTSIPVTATGTVNTAATGTYTIIYSATDSNNLTASTTRTVDVVASSTPPVVTPPADTSNQPGGAGGANGVPGCRDKTAKNYDPTAIYDGPCVYTATTTSSIGEVLGVSTSTVPIIDTSNASTTLSATATSSVTSKFNFGRDLKFGIRGNDVMELQRVLMASGYLIRQIPTNFFGNLTRNALKQWQKRNGISPASGYFGKLSREFLMK